MRDEAKKILVTGGTSFIGLYIGSGAEYDKSRDIKNVREDDIGETDYN
jgi:nucleoside-diphosphate-sugar epimerase